MEEQLLQKIAMYRLKIKDSDLQMINTKIRNTKMTVQRSRSCGSNAMMEKIETDHIKSLNHQIQQEITNIKTNGLLLAESKLFDKNNILEKYINPNQIDKFGTKPQPQLTEQEFDYIVAYSQSSIPVINKKQKQIDQFTAVAKDKVDQNYKRCVYNITHNQYYNDKMDGIKKVNKQRDQIYNNFQTVIANETIKKTNKIKDIQNRINNSAQRSSEFFNTRSKSLNQKYMENSLKTSQQHQSIQQNQEQSQQFLDNQIQEHFEDVQKRLNEIRYNQDQKFGQLDKQIVNIQQIKRVKCSIQEANIQQLVQKRNQHFQSNDAMSIRRQEETQIEQYESAKRQQERLEKIQQTRDNYQQQLTKKQDTSINYVNNSTKQLEAQKVQIETEYKNKLIQNKNQMMYLQQNQLCDQLKLQKVNDAKKLKDSLIEQKRLQLQLRYKRTEQCVQRQQQMKEEQKFFYQLTSPVQRMSERHSVVQNRCQSANPCNRIELHNLNNQSYINQNVQSQIISNKQKYD